MAAPRDSGGLPLLHGVFRAVTSSNQAFDRSSELWPLDVPVPPRAPQGKSKRWHTRHRMNRAVWQQACETIACVNGLNSGRDVVAKMSNLSDQRASEGHKFYQEVQRREAQVYRASQDACGSGSSGGDALRKLLKAAEGEYTPNKLQPVVLKRGMSGQVAEPSDGRAVSMMDAMSADARAFFEPGADGRPPCLLAPAEQIDTDKVDRK